MSQHVLFHRACRRHQCIDLHCIEDTSSNRNSVEVLLRQGGGEILVTDVDQFEIIAVMFRATNWWCRGHCTAAVTGATVNGVEHTAVVGRKQKASVQENSGDVKAVNSLKADRWSH